MALLVTLLLVAAACGGDDATSASEPASDDGGAASTDGDAAEAGSATEDGETPEEQAADGDTRVAQTLYGPVEVPISPTRVFALDEYAGAILLSMGIEPIGAFAPYAARVPQAILADAGVPTTEAVFGEWNLELLAEADPDLIVLMDVEDEVAVQSFSEVAPTVVLPFVAPWRDVLAAIGEATGDTVRTAAIEAGMEARIAEAADAADGSTVLSVVATGPSFGTFTIGADTSTAGILDEVGYARPDSQQQPSVAGAIVPMSPETLGDHDGDLLIALGGDARFYSIDELESLPLFASLEAVEDDRWVEALGEIWVNSDPFSMFWVIEDIASIGKGGTPATVEDRQARWEAYLALADN
ncbi:MAG: ABC transporter substrate-binding protein [Actinomycetota bacterium]